MKQCPICKMTYGQWHSTTCSYQGQILDQQFQKAEAPPSAWGPLPTYDDADPATGSAEFEAAAKAESERFGNSIACTPRYAHLVGARWGYERGKSEREKLSAESIAKALDGVAAVNLAEPTMDDLPRINAAYAAERKIRKRLEAELAKLKKAYESSIDHRKEQYDQIDRLTKENAELREDLKENQKAVNERGMSIQILKQERDELRAAYDEIYAWKANFLNDPEAKTARQRDEWKARAEKSEERRWTLWELCKRIKRKEKRYRSAGEKLADCMEHALELGYFAEGGSTHIWAKEACREWREVKG